MEGNENKQTNGPLGCRRGGRRSVADVAGSSGRRRRRRCRRRDGTARYNAIKTQPWKLTEIPGKGVVKVTVVYFVLRVNY